MSNYFFDFAEVRSKHYNEAFCRAFGTHLRELRINRKIGKRDFADLADIDYSQLSKIERGSTNPTISTVLAIAQALGLPPSELFNFPFSMT